MHSNTFKGEPFRLVKMQNEVIIQIDMKKAIENGIELFLTYNQMVVTKGNKKHRIPPVPYGYYF